MGVHPGLRPQLAAKQLEFPDCRQSTIDGRTTAPTLLITVVVDNAFRARSVVQWHGFCQGPLTGTSQADGIEGVTSTYYYYVADRTRYDRGCTAKFTGAMGVHPGLRPQLVAKQLESPDCRQSTIDGQTTTPTLLITVVVDNAFRARSVVQWHGFCQGPPTGTSPADSIDGMTSTYYYYVVDRTRYDQGCAENYLDSLIAIAQESNCDPEKGKAVISYAPLVKRPHEISTSTSVVKWLPSPVAWVKLNTDGSWTEDGRAGAGMVLHDTHGKIIYSSCRELFNRDALEAEISACMEGLSLAITDLPIFIEMDSLSAVNILNDNGTDMSVFASLVAQIKHLKSLRMTHIAHANRDQTLVSDFLAKFART